MRHSISAVEPAKGSCSLALPEKGRPLVSFPGKKPTPDELHRILAVLRDRDPSYQCFGAAGHRYQLRPALTDAAITQLEHRYQMQVPAEYREFLQHYGNGGAGPYYGILSLEAAIDDLRVSDDDLEPRFPIGAPFLPPPTEAAASALLYPSPGILPIAEVGCGGMVVIVTSGVEHQNLWMVNNLAMYLPTTACIGRSDIPLDSYLSGERKRERIGFWQWYSEWLHKLWCGEAYPA